MPPGVRGILCILLLQFCSHHSCADLPRMDAAPSSTTIFNEAGDVTHSPMGRCGDGGDVDDWERTVGAGLEEARELLRDYRRLKRREERKLKVAAKAGDGGHADAEEGVDEKEENDGDEDEGDWSWRRIGWVFMFGSRLHECHSPDADYDLIAIVRGEPYFHNSVVLDRDQLPLPPGRPKPALDVNLNLYHVDFFHTMLKKNMINALMCLDLPKRCVWKSDGTLAEMGDVLRIPALKKAILMDSSHNYAKAKRLWGEGDTRRSKKNLVHGLRYLLFETGHINDYTAGNNYWHEILDNPSTDWADYEGKYRPLYNSMMHNFKHGFEPPQCAKPTHEGNDDDNDEEARTGSRAVGMRVLRYLESQGMQSLCKEFSLTCSRHPQHPQLFQIVPDPESSPSDNPIVKECAYGIIVENTKATTSSSDKPGTSTSQSAEPTGSQVWKLVAFSYSKINYLVEPLTSTLMLPSTFKWTRKPDAGNKKTARKATTQPPPAQVHRIKVFEKLDGSLALLYWYGGSWHVASTNSVDGGEILVEEASLPKTTYPDWMNSNTINDEEEDRRKARHREQEKERQARRAGSSSSGASTERMFRFRDAFWQLWKEQGYQLPEDISTCYAFEMLSSKQMKIVRKSATSEHPKFDRLVLHGARDMRTFEERDIETIAEKNRWNCVRRVTEMEEMSVEEMIAAVNALDPLGAEGFVLCDAEYHRLKIRSAAWLSLALLSWFNDSNTNERCMLELVRRGRPSFAGANFDSDEFLRWFPEWEDDFRDAKAKFDAFVGYMDGVYSTLKEKSKDHQHFAKSAKTFPFSGLLFHFRAHDSPAVVRSFFATCPIKKLVTHMREHASGTFPPLPSTSN